MTIELNEFGHKSGEINLIPENSGVEKHFRLSLLHYQHTTNQRHHRYTLVR